MATLKLEDSFLLNDTTGTPMSGLDPVTRNSTNGLDLPGAATGAVSLDPEAIVRLPDGSLMISDEYGPALYHFSAEGRMLSAPCRRPPSCRCARASFDFSSNNPGPGAPKPAVEDPETGRQNNQGFEGLAYEPATKRLTVVLQSALRQDGGDKKSTRQNTRALVYDAADPDHLALVGEYVVPLPLFKDGDKTLVAAQSELAPLGDGRFLLLSRDSNNGWGVKGDTSLYRRVDLLDFTGATNIAGTAFDGLTPVAPKGVVDPSVTPATLTARWSTSTTMPSWPRPACTMARRMTRPTCRRSGNRWRWRRRFDPAHPNDVFLLTPMTTTS